MSGFEVVGVVLGALPLLIDALKQFSSGIENWTSYRLLLNRLIRDLSTEQINLETVCRRLLLKVPSPGQIPDLANNGSGMMAVWGDESLRPRIEKLLGTASSVFKGTLEDIYRSIKELETKLHLQDGQVRHPSRHFEIPHSSFSKEVRPMSHPISYQWNRFRFSWNKTEYDKIIITIQRGVSNLNALLEFAAYEEPRRRTRSQARLMDLVRETSSSVYRALRSNFSCGSDCTHEVHLGLESRSPGTVERGVDTPARPHLSFQLAVNYRTVHTITEAEERLCVNIFWKGLLMKTLQTDVMFGTVPIRYPPSSDQTGRKARAPIINTEQHPIQLRSSGGQNATINPHGSTPNPAPTAFDLCKEIRAGPKSKHTSCYGTIADITAKSTAFQVFPQTNLDGEECSTVSLHEILEGSGGTWLSYVDRLSLATKISSSFLQLYSTPWLPENLNSRHILFLKKGTIVDYGQAFVMKTFPDIDSRSSSSIPTGRGAALRCLGIILLELEFHETIESLRRAQDTRLRSSQPEEVDGLLSFSGDAVIDRLIRQTNWDGHYGKVVKLCINARFEQPMDLNNDKVRQDVYERVVQPLELDLGFTTFTV